MTRIVTYETGLPSPANDGDKMSDALMMMLRSANPMRILECHMHMDYALNSPSAIPAGSCVQVEIEDGETETGIQTYVVCAEQNIVERGAA